MKLKRFLLRYEPPGVGFEVEDPSTGSLEVHHKDLPNTDEVTSSKDVYELVDRLIADSAMLLTKKRHSKALVELMGRLYNVDVDAEAEEGDDRGMDKVAAVESADEADEGVHEGQTVVLIGLKGKLQVHNGELGTVSKARADKQKFEVILASSRTSEGGETLKVKGSEHMIPTAPKGTPLEVGTHVAIRGLRNHVELNGCLGRVVECHAESHRFEVRATESGQLFRVKQENLVPIEAIPSSFLPSKENREPNTSSPRQKKDGLASSSSPGNAPVDSALQPGSDTGDGDTFEIGSVVQLVGLKTAMCYNGQTAEVLSVDRARCRYEIRLNDGSVKTIRAENVRLVSPPTKTSPRTRRGKDGAKK
jgi:hypothetical protein